MADTLTKPGPNQGHGHVRPRADGLLARCGGPALCSECAREFAALHGEKKGKRGQNCNRTACQQPGATWYNVRTYAWYCPTCARLLNGNPGSNLCISGEEFDHQEAANA